MARQNYGTGQIIMKFREEEILCSQGKTMKKAIRQIGVSEQIYYRWRNKYGGMNTPDAKC